MNYKQVDAAVSFLYTPEIDLIVLQVPYPKDIGLVKEYIVANYGLPTENKIDELVFHTKVIRFEVIGSIYTGVGYKPNQVFFIDRINDVSYYKNLEVIS